MYVYVSLDWMFFKSKSIDIFFYFSKKTYEYSLEVPQWGTSNEYPYHIFCGEKKKKYLPDTSTHIWTYGS